MATEGLLKIAKTLCPYCNGSSPESHCQCGILTKAAMEGADLQESILVEQLAAAIKDYNEAKKEVKSKDWEILRIKMILESEYRKKKAKMQYREKEIEHYWQQFKKDHNL